MLKVVLFAFVGVLFLCLNASAQKVNTDSLKLISKIGEDQLKLGKLQNTVGQKTRDKEDDSLAAQQSADKNATAATRLSNDPQNKKIARQADNSAGDAKTNARKARNANSQLDKVNKEIADLQGKIAQEKAQLCRYTGVTNVPFASTAPAQQDSTHQR
jgi:cell division protein FtsL